MSDYIIGANALESLTEALYKTSWSIFREYIQNSCDSIDNAVRENIFTNRDQGCINIFIDKDSRNIKIEDNAAGVKADDFTRLLGSIAASEKNKDVDKGFRGIGRLCGLACCKTLTFSAKFKGEQVISRLTCDAALMRELTSSTEKLTADEVLKQIYKFSQDFTDDIDGHYFIAELEGISDEHSYLLDVDGVKNYLAFVAPLPYPENFAPFISQIHEHAEELGLRIDVYKIFLNNEQLFKPYKHEFTTSNGEDSIKSIKFIDLRDKDNNLFAWMWYGLSSFKAVIKESCKMRSIRLRKENIQIGDEDTLQNLFPEEKAIHYFAGELFCVSNVLIPNTSREYLKENSARAAFESAMKNIFMKLSGIYKKAAAIRSSLKKISDSEKIIEENQYRLDEGLYHDDERKQQLEGEIINAKSDIEKYNAAIEKCKSHSEIMREVAEYIEQEPAQEATVNDKPLSVSGKRLLRKVFGVILDEFGTGDYTKKLIETIKEKLNFNK